MIAEEHAIAQTIIRLIAFEYPVTYTLIEEIADEIRKCRTDDYFQVRVHFGVLNTQDESFEWMVYII